jgi:hypothetical protein
MNGIDTYEEHIPRSFKSIVKGGMYTKGWCSKRFPEIIAYDKQEQTSERQCRRQGASWMIDSLFKPRQGREISSLFENVQTSLGGPRSFLFIE